MKRKNDYAWKLYFPDEPVGLPRTFFGKVDWAYVARYMGNGEIRHDAKLAIDREEYPIALGMVKVLLEQPTKRGRTDEKDELKRNEVNSQLGLDILNAAFSKKQKTLLVEK